MQIVLNGKTVSLVEKTKEDGSKFHTVKALLPTPDGSKVIAIISVFSSEMIADLTSDKSK